MHSGCGRLLLFCRSAEEVRKNIECNALSAVDVTHHFLKRMVRQTHSSAHEWSYVSSSLCNMALGNYHLTRWPQGLTRVCEVCTSC